ncbi:MAG: VWA domain-containing protein [Actinomycetota bacterium]
MRRKALIALTIAALAAMSGVGRAQQSETNIRSVDAESFPKVSLTVSVGDKVATEEVTLEENGVAVESFDAVSLTESDNRVSVVLAIDVSGSMQGAPLSAAKTAASSFVRSMPEEIEVGIVTFADRPRVLLDLTTDHSAALESIRGLVAAGETALYDGVAAAAGLFSDEDQSNIVLLSDGGDTVSSASLKAATKAAGDAEAAVFSVGLESGEFDAEALRTMSSRTGGRYSPAATADLTGVYEELATELSGQFVVTYESVSEGGEELTLTVATAQGADTVLFLAPEVEVPPAPKRIAPAAPGGPVLEGAAGRAIALTATFLAVFGLMVMAFGSRARRKREEDLARRIESRVREHQEIAQPQSKEPRGPIEWIPVSVVHAAEKITENKEIKDKLDYRLERAGWPVAAAEFVALVGIASFGGMLVGIALMKNVVFALLMAGAGGAIPYIVLGFAVQRRSTKMQSQLADILMILASSLRAGHSFLQALDAVAKEIGGPGGQEFSRVVGEIRLGRKIEEALNDLAERVGSDDFEWAILAVNIQREVGGNLAEVLDTVAETIRERGVVRRQIQVLSAEGRLSIAILTALPFMVAIYMAFANPDYLGLLFSTRIGLAMVTVAAALMGVGLVWMRKVVKIDV